MSATLTVSPQGQLTLPKSWRSILGLKPGEKLNATLKKDNSDSALVLSKKPQNWTNYMAGLGKEIWEDVDVDEYIRKERDSWER